MSNFSRFGINVLVAVVLFIAYTADFLRNSLKSRKHGNAR